LREFGQRQVQYQTSQNVIGFLSHSTVSSEPNAEEEEADDDEPISDPENDNGERLSTTYESSDTLLFLWLESVI